MYMLFCEKEGRIRFAFSTEMQKLKQSDKKERIQDE